jgi:hypothetical protein
VRGAHNDLAQRSTRGPCRLRQTPNLCAILVAGVQTFRMRDWPRGVRGRRRTDGRCQARHRSIRRRRQVFAAPWRRDRLTSSVPSARMGVSDDRMRTHVESSISSFIPRFDVAKVVVYAFGCDKESGDGYHNGRAAPQERQWVRGSFRVQTTYPLTSTDEVMTPCTSSPFCPRVSPWKA